MNAFKIMRMKVLIDSLQVSESGSKGHLHPAIELALEVKRRGHLAARSCGVLYLDFDLEVLSQLRSAGINTAEMIIHPHLESVGLHTVVETCLGKPIC